MTKAKENSALVCKNWPRSYTDAYVVLKQALTRR